MYDVKNSYTKKMNITTYYVIIIKYVISSTF